MLNLNDGNLHENPFEISGEDMAAAAPSFKTMMIMIIIILT